MREADFRDDDVALGLCFDGLRGVTLDAFNRSQSIIPSFDIFW